jgi:hypothetical protein
MIYWWNRFFNAIPRRKSAIDCDNHLVDIWYQLDDGFSPFRFGLLGGFNDFTAR